MSFFEFSWPDKTLWNSRYQKNPGQEFICGVNMNEILTALFLGIGVVSGLFGGALYYLMIKIKGDL